MRFLYYLADTFINTFGITRPDQKARRHAAFFILTLLILLVVVVTAVGFVLRAALH